METKSDCWSNPLGHSCRWTYFLLKLTGVKLLVESALPRLPALLTWTIIIPDMVTHQPFHWVQSKRSCLKIRGYHCMPVLAPNALITTDLWPLLGAVSGASLLVTLFQVICCSSSLISLYRPHCCGLWKSSVIFLVYISGPLPTWQWCAFYHKTIQKWADG